MWPRFACVACKRPWGGVCIPLSFYVKAKPQTVSSVVPCALRFPRSGTRHCTCSAIPCFVVRDCFISRYYRFVGVICTNRTRRQHSCNRSRSYTSSHSHIEHSLVHAQYAHHDLHHARASPPGRWIGSVMVSVLLSHGVAELWQRPTVSSFGQHNP